MTHKEDSFDWVDVLMKRWQIVVALFGLVAWMTTMQLQMAAANAEVKSISEMKGEWPYLKNQVSRIENKVDSFDEKLDRLLSRTNV